MSLFQMEILKIRRSRLWLPILFLPLLSILFGTGNYLGNREVLQREWLSLFTQVYLFYGMFFFPTLVGLVMAFIWHQEHKKNALKLLLSTAYPSSSLLANKILLAFFLLVLTQAYLLLLYGLVGSFLGFSMAFPWILCAYVFLGTVLIFPLLACQSYLSLRLKSFALPVACAMGLGLIGFFVSAQSYLPELGNVFAFSKMSLLLNNLDSLTIALPAGDWLKMAGCSLLITFVFGVVQLRYLKKIRV